jgi:hypothetical protein
MAKLCKCGQPVYENFKACEKCLTTDPIPSDLSRADSDTILMIGPENSLDYFNRYIAGDR